MANDQSDLFEADGVTPKVVEKPAITAGELEARVAAARAEGKADALEKVATAPKVEAKEETKAKFTRAQLRASVEASEITQDQADDIWDAQRTEEIRAAARADALREVQGVTTAQTVQSEIDRYVDAHPDLTEDASELRAKVQEEFNYLVKLGDDPKNVSTQLKAIRAACGPLGKKGRRPAPESHEDIGGAGGSGNEKPEAQGWAKGLSSKTKAHYEKLVSRGIYKGFSDPKLVAELKLTRKAH